MMFRLLLILVLLFWFSGKTTNAEVVHYWPFTPGENFLKDSIGTADLAFDGVPVSSLQLPTNGHGERFPVALRDLGINQGAADFRQGIGGLISNQGVEIDGDFTVEVMANVQNLQLSPIGSHLVGQTNPADPAGWINGLSEFGWTLHVRTNNYGGSAFGELFLVTSEGVGYQHMLSGIVIQPERDYLIGAAFDIDPGETTFYVYEPERKELRISRVPRPSAHLPLNSTKHISVGELDAMPEFYSESVIDEVRISKGVVPFGDLLMSQAEFPDSIDNDVSLVTMSPSSLYHVTGENVRDVRNNLRLTFNDSRRLLSKFDLPPLDQAGARLDQATLRWHIGDVRGPANVEVSVWNSQSDDDFGYTATDFDDASYVDTSLDLFSPNDPENQYVELDVTDLIRADYLNDGDNPVSAFRVQSMGGSIYTLSLPRNPNLNARPELLLSFGVPGDFDDNGILDANDIDLLTTAGGDTKFDLNFDGLVNTADRDVWVTDLANTWYGDANLDGEFSSLDLVDVFQSGHFEDDLPMNSGWAEGDWNGDGDFTSADFVVAFQDGGYEQGPRGDVAQVPEPSAVTLVLLGMLGVMRAIRSQLTSPQRNVGRRVIIFTVAVLTAILADDQDASCDIYRWDNGEVIPGTEGIVLVRMPGTGDTNSTPGADLQELQLTYADLANTDLEEADLYDADLTNAHLRNANLVEAALVRTNLDGADFTGATVHGANFALAQNFRPTQLYSTASYQNKSLSGIGFIGLDLNGWSFVDQDLSGVFFEGSNLTNANLSRTDLTGVRFFGFHPVVVGGADFTDASINGTALIGLTRRGGFTAEQLYSTASYQLRELHDLDFADNDLSGWKFSGQDLSRSSFILANLSDAQLDHANLTDVDLTAADLSGTDLRGANLMNACLDRTTAPSAFPLLDADTIYNQWTVFPEWLDPESANLTSVETAAGDFDANGVLNAADFDRFRPRFNRSLNTQTDCLNRYISYHPPMFNLNGDRVVDEQDRAVWVRDIMGTWFGDANLDGEFNSQDLVDVFTAGEFEDGQSSNSGWASGDWNADGDFNTSDLVFAFQDGGYEQGPRAATAVVPEPSAGLLVFASSVSLSFLHRKTKICRPNRMTKTDETGVAS